MFGTGLNGVKCAYYLQNKSINIAYCLNNNCRESEFCGYSVYEPDVERLSGVFVIVATNHRVYPEISKQLQENGLREFQDYIYYEWIFKKIVLLHGNCHMLVIESFLMSSEIFCDNYITYPNPLICYNNEKKVEECVLKNCDIWIHEDIKPDNEFGYYLCDEYMRNYTKEDVVEIVIPHLFGLGKCFFPQSDWNKHNKKIANGKDINGMFPHSDKVIDKCVEKGMDKKSILEFCMGETAIDQDEIRDNFELYMDKIKEREKKWDIKIVDFILENYKYKKLFYDKGHPTNDILGKISIEILEKLGINDKNIYSEECLDYHEEPVYPIVRKTLGLKWDDGFIRKSDIAKKACSRMDFKEYIEEYLWWCYGIK